MEMTVPYMPLTVANTFIELGKSKGGVEHMKLQKLVYYAYGWWLGCYGLNKKRLTNEGPQVWKHGPVFSSLYATLSNFGREPIKELQTIQPFVPANVVKTEDEKPYTLIKWIWGRYGHLDSYTLSDMTHEPDTSWYRTAMKHNFVVPYNLKIDDKYIYEEFTKLLENEQGVKVAGQDINGQEYAQNR